MITLSPTCLPNISCDCEGGGECVPHDGIHVSARVRGLVGGEGEQTPIVKCIGVALHRSSTHFTMIACRCGCGVSEVGEECQWKGQVDVSVMSLHNLIAECCRRRVNFEVRFVMGMVDGSCWREESGVEL